MNLDDERLLRSRIFRDLERMQSQSDGTIARNQLLDYQIDGSRFALIDRSRGIRNPQGLAATLSAMSSSDGPYPDAEVAPGVWEYAFRDGPIDGGDNAKLIRAHELGLDIIYFHKQAPNVYYPLFPMRVVSVDRDRRVVTISLERV